MNQIEQILSTLTVEADYVRENTFSIQQTCDSIQNQLSPLVALDSIKNSIESISCTLKTPSPTIWGMNEGLALIVIPAFVSIFVFLAGLLINWYSRNSTNRTKAISFKESILYWCSQLIPTLEKQELALKEFANAVSSLKDLNTVTLSLYPIHFNQLNTIPLEKYIYAFKDTTTINSRNKQLNDKSADYYTYGLVTQFTYISNLYDQIKTEYNTYLDKVKFYMDKWNKINKDGKDICDQLIAIYPKEEEIKKLRAIIIDVLNNAPKGVDIPFMSTHYIHPILEWSSQNMIHKEYGGKAQILRSIYISLDELLYMYQMEITNGYSSRYLNSAERLNEGIKSMRNAIDYFSRCKTKYIIKHYI